MFCNEKGECVSTYDMSERCSSHESCGRDAMCVFKTTLSQYGFCTQILSLSEGSLVLPEYKASMSDTGNSVYKYQDNLEKICRTGYLNETTGRCSDGLTSKKKVSFKTVN